MIAHHEIDINAPLDTVRNLHTDVDAWPAWNLEVAAAKLDGALPHAMGRPAQGIMGTHEWWFAQGPAGVHVITTESWAGGPVDADPTGMQTILGNTLTGWLTRPKQKAESSARDS